MLGAPLHPLLQLHIYVVLVGLLTPVLTNDLHHLHFEQVLGAFLRLRVNCQQVDYSSLILVWGALGADFVNQHLYV
jgi:hypothetical protein